MSDDTLTEVEVEQVAEVEQPEVEQETIAEEAPASEEQHEQKSYGYEKRINKLTAQKYEQLDEINRLKAELDKRADTERPQPTRVEAPNPDLQFDDPAKWQEQMIAYNQQMWREQQEADRRAEESARQQQAQQEAAKKRQQEFFNKSETLGVDVEKALQSAALIQHRVSNEAAELLIQHSAAPALFEHLASNPVALEELNSVSNPFEMVEKINAMASQAVTRNISSAPEPAPTLSGVSAREPDEFDSRFPSAEWA